MAISFIGSAGTAYDVDMVPSSGPTTSFVIPLDAGGALVAGDFLIANISVDTANTTPTTPTLPSGWTSLTGQMMMGSGTTTVQQEIIYHFVTAGEAGTTPNWVYTPSGGTAKEGNVQVSRYRGVDQANPFAVASPFYAQTTVTTGAKIAPAVTTTVDNTMLVAGGGLRNGSLTLNSVTPSYTMLKEGNTGQGRSVVQAYKPMATAGDSGTATFTWSSTSNGGTFWQTALRPAVGNPAISTLTDDFATADSAKWAGYDAYTSVVGGQLVQQVNSAYAGSMDSGANVYSLVGSSAHVTLVQRPNVGNDTTEAYFRVALDGANYLSWLITGSTLTAFRTVAGTNTDIAVLTYNATTHRRLRIRESAGTIFWDTYDGTTWTQRASWVLSGFAVTAVRPTFIAGYWGTEPSPGTVIWDDFNVGPSPDTTAPTVPAGVTATANSSSQVTVSWTASTDAVGVASYRVRRNGVDLPAALTVAGTTFADSTVAPSTAYTYTVSAVDAAGNRSAEATATPNPVTTPAAPVAGPGTNLTVKWDGTSASAILPADAITASDITIGSAQVSLEAPYTGTSYDPNKVFQVVNEVTASIDMASAVANNAYVSVTISRAGGMLPKAVRLKAARGGSSTARGLGLRSSVDGYAADLFGGNVPTLRPTLTQYTANLSAMAQQTAITFRIYQYTPATDNSLEYDDLEFDYTTPGGTVPAGTLNHLWTGVPDSNSVPVKLKTTGAASVRLKVGTNAGVTTGVVFTSAGTPDVNGYTTIIASGLTADTQYWYQAEVDGVLDTANTGSFKTDVTVGTAKNFRVAFSSCLTSGNTTSTAFDNIITNAPEVMLHLGDWHYDNDTTTSAAAHRTSVVNAINGNAGLKSALRNIPFDYVWSDHDSGNNDWTGGPAAWTPSYNTAYRDLVPFEAALPNTGGVYHSFGRGRVKFIMTDGRSFKSPAASTDDANKTMFGAAQEAWIANELADPNYIVKIIAMDVPWVFAATAGDDKWGGYTNAANKLVAAIAAANAKVFLIHGDAHTLCADDGTSVNNRGSLPVAGAAPLGNSTSLKGGPYSQGHYPNPVGSNQNQHGLLDITDTGSQITVRFSGRDTTNTERIVLSKTYSAAAPGPGLTLVGGTTVSAMNVGSTPVTAAYVGSTKVF